MFGGELLPGEGSKQNADWSEYDGAESRRENIFKYRYDQICGVYEFGRL